MKTKTIRTNVKTCTGTISASLKAAYEELLAAIPRQEQLGSDETCFKNNGKKHWIWCLTAAAFSVNKFKAAAVDFELQRRDVGGLFRPFFRLSLDSGAQSTIHIPFDPYLIVPKNSDVRVVATGDSAGISVEATFQAYLAGVV